ncbi:MAG: bifunctional metallophosphatase/5'-nucleotidase [Nocardioides sp.]
MSSIRKTRGRALVAAVAGLALVATPLVLTQGAAAGDLRVTKVAKSEKKTIDLQLLSFNDFHGHLEATDSPQRPLPPVCPPATEGAPCSPPVGGVEYLASHISALRAEQPKSTLTVAAGDLIGGSTFLSGLFQDQPTIEAMNILGLDVSSVGNHEFDEGTRELKRMVRGGCHPDKGCFKDADGKDIPYEGAEFDYLAANVIKKSNDRPFLPARSVKEIKGVKVGFIGMTLQGTPSLVNPAGIASVDFRDEVRTARKHARILKDRGVQTIVVLVHEGGFQSAGYTDCSGISDPILTIAKKLPASIDAVISGHTHQPYVCKIADPKGKKRLVTSAGSFGQVLTESHLVINKRTGDVMRARSHAENHLVTRDVAKHRGESYLLAFWKSLSDPLAASVVGTVAEDIRGDQSTCRCEETPMGDLIADAILFGTQAPEDGGAQFALMNTSGVRDELIVSEVPKGEEPGEITYSEAYNVAPFGNLLVTLDMTGEQIYDVLNQQFQRGITGRRVMLSFGVSEGFTYDWVWEGDTPLPNAQPGAGTTGGHVVPGSVAINGVPIEMDSTYRVGTIDFLANGGDSFTAFTSGTNRLGGAEDLANLVDFLGANPGLTAPEDRINGL